MNIIQSRSNLTDITRSHRHGQGTMRLHCILKRAATQIVHHIIGRAVLLEHIDHTDDMGMRKRINMTRLLNEFLPKTEHKLPASRCSHRDLMRTRIPVTMIFHEKLLDRHTAVQRDMPAQISYAEATLS